MQGWVMNTIKNALDGYIGKSALGLLMAILTGLSVLVFNTTFQHSTDLASLKTSVDALGGNITEIKQALKEKITTIDGDLGKVIDVQATLTAEVRALEAAQNQRDIDSGRMLPKRVQPN
jgi:hypothetical protein